MEAQLLFCWQRSLHFIFWSFCISLPAVLQGWLSCIQALQAFCMHNPSASKSLVSTALQMLIFSIQNYDALCRLPGSEASDDLSLQKLMKQQELAEDLKASYKWAAQHAWAVGLSPYKQHFFYVRRDMPVDDLRQYLVVDLIWEDCRGIGGFFCQFVEVAKGIALCLCHSVRINLFCELLTLSIMRLVFCLVDCQPDIILQELSEDLPL